jgi:hypothetical protein
VWCQLGVSVECGQLSVVSWVWSQLGVSVTRGTKSWQEPSATVSMAKLGRLSDHERMETMRLRPSHERRLAVCCAASAEASAARSCLAKRLPDHWRARRIIKAVA